MKIKLKKSFAANTPADEYDVRQIKKALNRLGYYTPFEKTGITGIPDTAVFAALKSFQKDHGLRATGAAKPDDETVAKLESEATKNKGGKYVWRTVGDERVREGHAAFNGTIRDLVDSPDPGEEFNCRCWADFEAAEQGVFNSLAQTERKIQPQKHPELEKAKKEAQNSLEFFKSKGYKLSYRFFKHYLEGSGDTLKISQEEMDNSPRLSEAIRKNKKRFEDSIIKGRVDAKFHDGKFVYKIEGTPSPFKERIENMKDGETIYLDKNEPGKGDFWDQDIPASPISAHLGFNKDPDQALSTGSVKVRSRGYLQATRKGDQIKIAGRVDHILQDTYDFDDETAFERANFRNEKLLADEGNARPFRVTGTKPEAVTGILTLENGKIKNWTFQWKNMNK